MDSPKPQRRSPPPTARPLKPRKFRSSCDACSASKVKCEQTQPHCQRCVNLGLTCNYSPSRRMGKPPASARKLTTMSNPSSSETEVKEPRPAKKRQLSPPSFIPDLPATDSTDQQSAMDAIFADEFMNINWQDDTFQSAMLNDTSTIDIDLTSNMFDLSFDFMADSFTPLMQGEQFTFGDESQDSNSLSTRNTTCENLLLLSSPQLSSTSNSTSTSTSNSTHDSPSSSFTFNSNKQNRQELVQQPTLTPPQLKTAFPKLSLKTKPQDTNPNCTHTLDFQHQSLTSPIRNPSSPTTTSIDQVLIKNKLAMEHAYTLLSCSCSNDAHFALTLALVCNKILGLYEAVIHSHCSVSPTIEEVLESGNGSSMNLCNDRTSPFLVGAKNRSSKPKSKGETICITVGAYTLDEEDEERLRLQIVVNELRKVRSLVDRYKSKYCEGGESIYAALEGFLRQKLMSSLKELGTRLEC